MDTFGSRLVKFRKVHLGMSKQSQLVEALKKYDITQANVSHWESDRSLPNSEKLNILQKVYPELNAEWLLTGKGEMLKETRNLTPIPDQPPAIAKEGSLERKLLELEIENKILREQLNNYINRGR